MKLNRPRGAMHSSPSIRDSFAAALLDPDLPMPAGLTSWNGSDVTARFAVYRNNVVVSLLGVLADTFPVVRQLVGDEFFRAMARRFVRDRPPRSAVMLDYGDTFPAWLADFEPAAALPYLADVARLEFARLQAFHAADAFPIEHGSLARTLDEPRQLASTALELHPSLTVLASDHPIVSLWAAHQLDESDRDAALARIDLAEGEAAVVLRHHDDALVLPVTRADGELARRLRVGQSLAAALAGAPSADLVRLLALLLRHDAIVGLCGATCTPAATAENPT